MRPDTVGATFGPTTGVDYNQTVTVAIVIFIILGKIDTLFFGFLDRMAPTDVGLEVEGWILLEDGPPDAVEIQLPGGAR